MNILLFALSFGSLLASRPAQAAVVSAGPAVHRAEFSVPAVAAAPVPAPAPDARFEAAVASFQGYIAGKKVRDPGDLPFLLSHGSKAAGTVLLVHGLKDSPYYMRTLADVFYEAGYNVVGLLLPGHGTKPEDLLSVRLEQWQDEVRYGLGIARELGETVSLAGFSTGGALELDALAANYRGPDPAPIRDLLLFSPAIKIANRKAELACLPGVRQVMERTHPWSGDAAAPEDSPYKYRKLALNAVCELGELTLRNAVRAPALRRDIREHGIGVFAVESAADTTIDPDSVVRFMHKLPQGIRQDFILYPKDAGVPHGSVTRPETNPFYGELADRLRAFIAPRPLPAAASASVFLQPFHSGILDQLSGGAPF